MTYNVNCKHLTWIYRNAARRRRSQRGQRCLAFSFRLKLEKYVFQGSFLSRVFCAAGKFYEVFPAKKTGGQAVCKRHYLLFPGPKTDKLPADQGEKARPRQHPRCKKDRQATRKHRGSAGFFVEAEENIIRSIGELYKNHSHFCRVLKQEKTRSFQTGSWWWRIRDSNPRPLACDASALTS